VCVCVCVCVYTHNTGTQYDRHGASRCVRRSSRCQSGVVFEFIFLVSFVCIGLIYMSLLTDTGRRDVCVAQVDVNQVSFLNVSFIWSLLYVQVSFICLF